MAKIQTIRPTEKQREIVVKRYALPLTVVESLCGPEAFLVDQRGRMVVAGPICESPSREDYRFAVGLARLVCDAVNEKWCGEGGYEQYEKAAGPTPWGRKDENWQIPEGKVSAGGQA